MRAILLALILLAPLQVLAKWDRAGENDESILYMDFDNIKFVEEGRFRRAWFLIDDKRPANKMSSRLYIEFDCVDRRSRFLDITVFSGAMATGNVTERIDTPADWKYVVPGSLISPAEDLLCSMVKDSDGKQGKAYSLDRLLEKIERMGDTRRRQEESKK